MSGSGVGIGVGGNQDESAAVRERISGSRIPDPPGYHFPVGPSPLSMIFFQQNILTVARCRSPRIISARFRSSSSCYRIESPGRRGGLEAALHQRRRIRRIAGPPSPLLPLLLPLRTGTPNPIEFTKNIN